MSGLRDTERMHAHRVSNIHGMVFLFSLFRSSLSFEHVTGLWFKVDRNSHVCRHSFVFIMQLRNWNTFPVRRKKRKAVIKLLVILRETACMVSP